MIGNPPFLGGKLLNTHLGEDYVSRVFKVYADRVPAEADLVCYWFVKAGEQVGAGKTNRVGLVSTNSIRGGANRRALQNATGNRPIFDAWSDEPWVIDGAAVRVSLVCFAELGEESALERRLDGHVVDAVHTDLTARRGTAGVDLTKVQRLDQNRGVAFMGDTKGGPFDVSGEEAREWLRAPANPNGRPNSDVLRPWMNGMDVTRRAAGKWIVDFGWTMAEEDAALYEAPFQHAKAHVYPKRQANRRDAYWEYWWRHVEPRQGMWRALSGLSRYIATPTVAKHRLFAWLDSRICPDHQLIVIARDDDVTFGILHSRFHETWSLRLGTSVTSHMICRICPGNLLVVTRRRGGRYEALRGGFGEGGAGRARGDHAQGLASIAEGDQRADSAQLRRGRVQRAPGARGGHCRGPAHQCAQGGSGQEAFRRGGHGGGARRPAGSPSQLRAQGRRRVRGAPGGAELRRAAGGPLAVVAAIAGGPRRGTRPHRQCVARDGAPGPEKTQSSRGGASAG